MWVALSSCDDWVTRTIVNSRPMVITPGTPKPFKCTYLRCAICAAVAFCGPPIWDPTVKTSSSDIVPSFVSCWSATRFAIFSVVGCSRKAERPLDQCPEGWNIKSEQVGDFQCYLKRDGNAQKGRDVEEGERQAGSGRAAQSSKLLRCSSSCIHHLQNDACVTSDTRFRDSLWRCWLSRICTFSTAHNKLT